MTFIEELEKSEGIFSLLELPKFKGDMYKFLVDKKLEPIQSQRVYKEKNKIISKRLVFRTNQNFYIFAELDENIQEVTWDCSIYFKEKSYKELVFFLNNFFKNFVHATTNN